MGTSCAANPHNRPEPLAPTMTSGKISKSKGRRRKGLSLSARRQARSAFSTAYGVA